MLLRTARAPLGLALLLALASACSAGDSPPAEAQAAPAVIGAPPPAPGGPGPAPVPVEEEPSGPPSVGLVGRFDTTDASAPLASWPGARVIARFEGEAASVRLDETVVDEEGGPSEWDVVVDGKVGAKLTLAPGTHDYVLAKGLAPGVHTVEIYRRSEAQNAVTRFLGFDLEQGKLLAPPRRPDRRIEIVGDSQPAAFGIEGVGKGPDCPGADWASRYENFHRSFGARLGETLSADVHGTVYSGKGVERNIWRPDKDTMPRIYGRANPLDPASRWDFNAFVPDAVVVMIGGNDFAEGLPRDNGAPSAGAFAAAYDAFIKDVRAAHPAAHVFLALSPSLSDAEPAGRATRTNVKAGIDAVVAERAAAGDARVYAVTPRAADAATELTGCNGHGNDAFHARVAAELSVVVRAKLGW
jgi:lysophospholipase L1-like esterase